jgi:hypothetical protein
VFVCVVIVSWIAEETNSSILFQAGAIGHFRQTGDQFHLDLEQGLATP